MNRNLSPWYATYIEHVEFRTRGDGSIPGLSVFTRKGERSMTPKQVEECIAEQSLNKPHRGIDFDPSTQPARADFAFDGRTFKPTANTKPSK